jgi:hypothetical protein
MKRGRGDVLRLRPWSDPGNASWQSDLPLFYLKVGDVELRQGVKIDMAKLQQGLKIDDAEVDQGQVVQALDSYRAGFAIAERLAKSDPSNGDWQRTLSLSYQEVGGVEVLQGQLAQALESFQASALTQTEDTAIGASFSKIALAEVVHVKGRQSLLWASM